MVDVRVACGRSTHKSGRATPAAIRNITEEQVGMWYLCVLQMGKKCHVGFGRVWTATG